MCIVNTPKEAARILRAVADEIEKFEDTRDENWSDKIDAQVVIDAANDLLGIVCIDEVVTPRGHTILRAVDFDYDAFFHSVVQGSLLQEAKGNQSGL